MEPRFWIRAQVVGVRGSDAKASCGHKFFRSPVLEHRSPAKTLKMNLGELLGFAALGTPFSFSIFCYPSSVAASKIRGKSLGASIPIAKPRCSIYERWRWLAPPICPPVRLRRFVIKVSVSAFPLRSRGFQYTNPGACWRRRPRRIELSFSKKNGLQKVTIFFLKNGLFGQLFGLSCPSPLLNYFLSVPRSGFEDFY